MFFNNVNVEIKISKLPYFYLNQMNFLINQIVIQINKANKLKEEKKDLKTEKAIMKCLTNR